MTGFPRDVLDAAAKQREVRLITVGRTSGKPRAVTIWIATDGDRLFIRSGAGLTRDWPRNLMARARATLQLGGKKVEVKPRHMTDPAEARSISALVRGKYGVDVRVSKPDEPLTQGEQATFELLPAD